MLNNLTLRTCAASLWVLPLVLAEPTLARAPERWVATHGPATQPACADTVVGATRPQAAAASSAAPQTVLLRGIVMAPNGRPRAGAGVYVAGAPRQLVVTDAQGAFTLPVPAGAAASLRVEYFGEGSRRVDVPTPTGEPLRITL